MFRWALGGMLLAVLSLAGRADRPDGLKLLFEDDFSKGAERWKPTDAKAWKVIDTKEGKAFNADPRGGPWASVIRHDDAFAAAYVKLDPEKYKAIVRNMRDALFDRDTSPGAEPEELLALEVPAYIVPGRDESHATSAARYLEECLPKSQYWDALPEAQTEKAAAPRLIQFLEAVRIQ